MDFGPRMFFSYINRFYLLNFLLYKNYPNINEDKKIII